MSLRRLPPLHAVRAFEAAARHLSMTRAAEELHVTPGAVSRHVRALETQMETVLFQRRSTGLVLTPAGEALAGVTRDALDGIANAVSGVRRLQLRRLTIGAYGFFASRALFPNSVSTCTRVRMRSIWRRVATMPSSLCRTAHSGPALCRAN